jgi:hypothetical protein
MKWSGNYLHAVFVCNLHNYKCRCPICRVRAAYLRCRRVQPLYVTINVGRVQLCVCVQTSAENDPSPSARQHRRRAFMYAVGNDKDLTYLRGPAGLPGPAVSRACCTLHCCIIAGTKGHSRLARLSGVSWWLCAHFVVFDFIILLNKYS